MNLLDPATYQSLIGSWLAGLPLAYAFGAGVLASVNPCGFLMLPAYATYYVSTEDARDLAGTELERAARAAQLALIATLGFLVVFGSLGLVIALGGHALVSAFPYASLAVGALLILLGIGLLFTRRQLSFGMAGRVRVARSRSLRGVFLFGVAYAVASLGCTLPIFLTVVGSAISAHRFLNAIIQFVNYALGMGLVLLIVSLSAAFAQGALMARMRQLAPYVERIGGVLLLAAGAYLVYTWFSLGRTLV